MAVQIIKQGIMDTLQDKGRYGFQQIGIPPCGYLDYLSAQLSNFILGNPLDAAIIELHFPASIFKFDSAHTICISGANFVPVLNDKSIAMNAAVKVYKNDVLKFVQPIMGKTSYLSIKGNINSPSWLNSKSYFSKQLQINETINITNEDTTDQISSDFAPEPSSSKCLANKIQKHIFESHEIRFIPGPQWNDLTAASMMQLLHQPFNNTNHTNRMGYTLKGPSLHLVHQKSYLSSAVTKGTMQLLPNGDLTILMADHQTIGGYANIGQIILVDLPKLVQLKTNHPFHFTLTNIQTAHKEYLEIQQWFS